MAMPIETRIQQSAKRSRSPAFTTETIYKASTTTPYPPGDRLLIDFDLPKKPDGYELTESEKYNPTIKKNNSGVPATTHIQSQ